MYQVHCEQVINNTRNDKCASELQRTEFLLLAATANYMVKKVYT